MSQLSYSFSPRDPPVHRAPLWLKWAVIFALTLACTLTHNAWVPALTLIVVVFIGMTARISAAQWKETLYQLLWLIAALALYYIVFDKILQGLEVIFTLLTLVIASMILLSTTPMNRLIDGFIRACKPLAYVGISPELMGLAIAIMLRSIPVLMHNWRAIEQSAQARGISLGPHRLMIPWVISTVAFAQETGDALVARGLDSAPPAKGK